MKTRSKVTIKRAKAKGRHTANPKHRTPSKGAPRHSSSGAGEHTEVARLTRELQDASERQAATTEVLYAISAQSQRLDKVFVLMLGKAIRICDARFGSLFRFDGETIEPLAQINVPKKLIDAQQRRGSYHATPGGLLDRVLHTGQVISTSDAAAEAVRGLAATFAGARSVVGVPMLKDAKVIGAMVIYRQELHPFTEKQIALVENFAAQAVIAIENARLLNELRQRTTDLSQRTTELTEALEQQTATSEVLRVISSSQGELQPVFESILANATSVCHAQFGHLLLCEGDAFRNVATSDAPTALAGKTLGQLFRPHPESPLAQAATTKHPVQVRDLKESRPYLDGHPAVVMQVEIGGARTLVAVPMLSGGGLIGVIILYRNKIHLFTDKQIDLVKNFAAQAVIAIENARLLNELRQSLEQQTATADVLKVISSSPGALEPVFKALLKNATQLCGASYGNMWLCEGDAFRSVALHGELPATYLERWGAGALFTPGPDVPLARAAETKQPFQIADIRESQPYREGNPLALSAVNEAAILAVLAVPMLKEGDLVGAILIYSKEARPFTEKQIELLENFASQAVIAIENARLLNELRQSLEQQTATSEVLGVISNSPGDLVPVFTSMLRNAVHICDATFGNILRWDGEALHLAAAHNTPPAFAEVRRRSPNRPNPKSAVGRMIETKAVVHIADARNAIERDPVLGAAVELGGVRTVLYVPLLKEDELVGAFTLSRQEVRPFTDEQIGLVRNFAAQAVVAIENARLLTELRERTDEVEKLNQQLEQRVADQVGEIERMGRLRRFLPPQVADLIVASGSEKQLESHRREITALFCDLRGFTGFTESADAEDVMALLRDYHAAIGEIIIKYNGTLERYAGDGVMVVFNDPVPVENPALQAVLMALEVRDAIGALTEKWRRWGHDIGFGIGIAHGFATLGTIGFEGRFDYAAIGTVSNVASRLCDEAKPGQILISPRVLTKVENAVKVEPVGEFELKGIRRPLAAYNVVGVAP